MEKRIHCVTNQRGIHSFYVSVDGKDYYLFSQEYRKGVSRYFGFGGVTLGQALDFSRSKKDVSIVRTMHKLPMYIKFVEKEYGIEVLTQTVKKNAARKKGGYRSAA